MKIIPQKCDNTLRSEAAVLNLSVITEADKRTGDNNGLQDHKPIKIKTLAL